jgi:hypothetical protein
MKKLFILILLVCPIIASAQAIRMSPNTFIPRPNLKKIISDSVDAPTATSKSAKRVKTATEIKNDSEALIPVTIGGTVSGETVSGGTLTGGTSTTSGDITTTTGATISDGQLSGGKNVGGTTYDPTSGGVTTGGTTVNGITSGGITVGGTTTISKTSKVTTDATTTFGITKGGTTFGGVTKYSAWVLNTNFTIPLVRVNFLVNNPQNSTNSQASTSFFNSVGAGINISHGELDATKDNNNNITGVEFYNHIGFTFGFLFAANSNSGSSTTQTGSTTTPTGSTATTTGSSTTTTNQSSTIFALVAGVSILNIQVGAGYELGSLTSGQRRGFLAISYAIPASTLVDGGYKILGISKSKQISY